MRRYGFREEGSQLAVGLLEAAAAFDGRLPELFAGFDRSETAFPVRYPDASCPQAFAAGAPLLALRTLLGLDVPGGELVSIPHLPEQVGTIELRGLVPQNAGQLTSRTIGPRPNGEANSSPTRA